jgi:poly(hydroxyalkanoate) depolymerase family esterase
MNDKKFSPHSFIVLILFLATISFGKLVSAGNWQQNVSVGGFNNVHIYTPSSQSSIGDGKALLIVLHGCVQPINNYLNAQLETAAEQYGMVVAVPDAMNKAGYSCWSYWQGTKSRSAGDYKNLINLANTLSNDSARNIDPDQVYIAGLSSGASFANTTACLAPDVFAGMGISAGPSIGTSSNGALGPCEAADVKARCESYAGSYQSHFATQIASIGHGDADTTVNQCYNRQNAEGMAAVYGVGELSGSQIISEGSRTADETLWQNGRVSMLWFNNLDHSWSGGQGASGDYISDASINYASYLGAFFTANNQRVDRNQGPVISSLSANDYGGGLAISGQAQDAETQVNSVSIAIYSLNTAPPSQVETLTASLSSNGNFSGNTSALSDGLYDIRAIATDDQSKAGDEQSITARVGPEPADTAPSISDVMVTVSGQCAVVSGYAVDVNQNLSSVTVNFSNGNIAADINGNQFSAEQCQLPGGQQQATVTASDTTNLSSSQTISFEVDAGVTGDYNKHIELGHIKWGDGYSECYLAFGTAEFTMREYSASNNQCEWIADGEPSCNGPVQACRNGGDDGGNYGGGNDGGGTTDPDTDGDGITDANDNCPNQANADQADNDGDGIGNVCDATPDGEVNCTDTSTSNYYHVNAGRATTDGSYAYAKGSGENMGLYNVYAQTTLREVSPGYFEIGSCP